MLSGAVAAAAAASSNLPASRSATTRDLQAENVTTSGSLYPKTMTHSSHAEKLDFITAQREKLGVLMKALDREQQSLDLAYGDNGLTEKLKNKSTHSFETVEHADADNGIPSSLMPGAGRRTTSGNWLPTGGSWNPWASPTPRKNTAVDATGSPGWSAARDMTDEIQGASTAFDSGR